MYYNEFQATCDSYIKASVRLKKENKGKEYLINHLDFLNMKYDYYYDLLTSLYYKTGPAFKYYTETLGSWVNETGLAGQIKKAERELLNKYNCVYGVKN